MILINYLEMIRSLPDPPPCGELVVLTEESGKSNEIFLFPVDGIHEPQNITEIVIAVAEIVATGKSSYFITTENQVAIIAISALNRLVLVRLDLGKNRSASLLFNEHYEGWYVVPPVGMALSNSYLLLMHRRSARLLCAKTGEVVMVVYEGEYIPSNVVVVPPTRVFAFVIHSTFWTLDPITKKIQKHLETVIIRALLKDGTLDIGHYYDNTYGTLMKIKNNTVSFAIAPNIADAISWNLSHCLSRTPREQLVCSTQEGDLIVWHPAKSQICLLRIDGKRKVLQSDDSKNTDEIFRHAVDEHDNMDVVSMKFMYCGQPVYDPYRAKLDWDVISCSLTLMSHLDEVWRFNGRDITPSISMLTKQSLRQQNVTNNQDVTGREANILCILPDGNVVGATIDNKSSDLVCMSSDLQTTYWRKNISKLPVKLVRYISSFNSSAMDVYFEIFSLYFPMDISKLILNYFIV
jgi:hypothetical protein